MREGSTSAGRKVEKRLPRSDNDLEIGNNNITTLSKEVFKAFELW